MRTCFVSIPARRDSQLAASQITSNECLIHVQCISIAQTQRRDGWCPLACSVAQHGLPRYSDKSDFIAVLPLARMVPQISASWERLFSAIDLPDLVVLADCHQGAAPTSVSSRGAPDFQRQDWLMVGQPGFCLPVLSTFLQMSPIRAPAFHQLGIAELHHPGCLFWSLPVC